ncbi:MAG: transposase [Proteobacteria bacterium]|nr:transposase [Pseudomonadota bacterium]
MTDSSIERVEVITGVQRRRRWGLAEKLGIVGESLRPGASVTAVARRHGLNPSQVFTWRRLARRGAFGPFPGAAAGFVPVHLLAEGHGVRPTSAAAVVTPEPRPAGCRAEDRGALAEIELPNGLCLRVSTGIEAAALHGLVKALMAVG